MEGTSNAARCKLMPRPGGIALFKTDTAYFTSPFVAGYFR